MKVLAVCSHSGLGGAELSFAVFLEHRPRHVDAVALLVSDGPLRERVAGLGVPVHVASGYDGRPTLPRLVRFTRELRRFLRHHEPTVVWAMGLKAALLAAPVCRAAGMPIVWHKVDFSWDRLLALPVAAAVDGVIAVSDAAAAALGPLRRARLLGTVGPPLRPRGAERADGSRARQPRVGTLARLVPYKGHHHIIRAAAILTEEFPELRVTLAGAPAADYPDYGQSLQALADRLGVLSRVELPGFQSAEDVLEGLAVFVNATYRDDDGYGSEGLSLAMLEASLAGLPVVATRGGGTGEGLLDGETGTLVEDADPRLLANAIAPYLRDPELAARTGAAGREFVRERFAAEPAARRLFDLLAVPSSSA
jgi:glycosyltransferase involved in cell wall biosynthesis